MPRFRCDCGHVTRIPAEAVGRKAKCPGCKQTVLLSIEDAAAPDEPPPSDVDGPPASAGPPNRPPPRKRPSGFDSGGDDKLEVLSSAQGAGFCAEVLAWERLDGCKDVRGAQSIYFANHAGIRLKQVRIRLAQSEAILEAGALHFMHGRLEMLAKTEGIKGLGKALANRVLSGEAAFRPRYQGTGVLYLEPSFSHFLIYPLQDEALIVDKGMFYCSEGSVDVGVAIQKNVSSSLFGGEGWFQTKVAGRGICVLECPVPADEVRCIELHDETLQVDGNFALMRTAGIRFSVEKSSRGLIRTLSGGEGLLQTFRGTGKVWLAPTQAVYDVVSAGGVAALQQGSHSSNTTTKAIGSLLSG